MVGFLRKRQHAAASFIETMNSTTRGRQPGLRRKEKKKKDFNCSTPPRPQRPQRWLVGCIERERKKKTNNLCTFKELSGSGKSI